MRDASDELVSPVLASVTFVIRTDFLRQDGAHINDTQDLRAHPPFRDDAGVSVDAEASSGVTCIDAIPVVPSERLAVSVQDTPAESVKTEPPLGLDASVMQMNVSDSSAADKSSKSTSQEQKSGLSESSRVPATEASGGTQKITPLTRANPADDDRRNFADRRAGAKILMANPYASTACLCACAQHWSEH